MVYSFPLFGYGLLGHELIAIDGCEMSSNAAKEHSVTFKDFELKREKTLKYIKSCMAEHKVLDKRKPREKAQFDKLNSLGDLIYQGNLFSKPVTAGFL